MRAAWVAGSLKSGALNNDVGCQWDLCSWIEPTLDSAPHWYQITRWSESRTAWVLHRCQHATRWSGDADGLVSELEQCHLVLEAPSDVAELVECYDCTLSTLLDKFAPQRHVRIMARASAAWFEEDCWRCKVTIYKLEKMYRKKPYNQSSGSSHKKYGRSGNPRQQLRSVRYALAMQHMWQSANHNCLN